MSFEPPRILAKLSYKNNEFTPPPENIGKLLPEVAELGHRCFKSENAFYTFAKLLLFLLSLF